MRLVDADALLEEYDRVHVGEPGRARKLIEDAPTVDAIRVGTEFNASDFTVFAIPEQHIKREGMFGIHKIYGKFRIERTSKLND